MTDTLKARLAEAREAVATLNAVIEETERRIHELETAARQSAEAVLTVVNGQPTTEAETPKPERKPRQRRQRAPRGQAQQKVREAIASFDGGRWTAKDIAQATGAKDPSSVYRHIRKMAETGEIHESGRIDGAQAYEVLIAESAGNGSGDETQVPAPV